MLWFLKRVGAGFFVKIFRGVAGPILEHFQHKDRQVSVRQGTSAAALVSASQADVEHRRLAMQERASNPFLMGIYVMIIIGPALYWFLFWMDTIFAGQVWTLHLEIWGWTLIEWEIMNWVTWDLPRAPKRLEEYGKQILMTFIGGGSAVVGMVGAAKALNKAGIFRGK